MPAATRVVDALRGEVAVGEVVTVKGWIRNRRDSKAGGGLAFLTVHDGSCFDPIQVVARASLDNFASEVAHLTTGCSVIVTGTLVESKGKGQSTEIQADSVDVVGWVEDPETYPVAPKQHSFEYLREVAHLRPRTNTFGAVTRVRHTLSMALHRFFDERGFAWIHTPIITANDAEGAGAMFRVSTLDLANLPRSPGGEVDFSQDFFGRETHLTVSGQLDIEAYCLAMSRVYTFGPTFRAENSNTARHLAEFWMVEPEIAFADLSDNADLAEACLRYVVQAVLDERGDDMAFFADRIDPGCISRIEGLVASTFERMDYTDAVEALAKAGVPFEFPVAWGMDLQSEHERWLTETHVGRPVIVMNYPKEIKAFYMRLSDDERTVAAMDVLAPGIGEIVGGSQREERLDVLDARMAELGLDAGAYWWYRDLRRYGTVPHAGFGLGFERTVAYITGMANVRDVIPFPRTPRERGLLTVRRSAAALVLALVALVAPAAGAQPIDVRRDLEYGTANGKRLLLDAYVPPAGEDRRPAVVMIHGGGWRAGDKASWQPEAEKLAAKGWVAFSVNYRLDEPAVFPAEIDDVQAAVRWVRAHAEEYRVDPARIAAIGESAGGHLTAMLATLGRGALDRDARIRVGVAWSPPVDLTALAGSRGAGWIGPLLGCNQQTCPDRLAQSSPVTHVDGTDAPLHLVSSTEELVPLSQSQAMAERLKAAGVDHRLDVYPGNRHALDFRADAWAPTLAFLEKHLAAAPEEDEAPPFLEAAFGVTALGAVGVLLLRRRRHPPGRP